MPIEIQSEDNGRLLKIQLTGKLQAEDYKHFVPAVEQAVEQHGKVRMLVEMRDFHGWTVGALWQDIKFDAKHFSHIERLAMAGDKKWEEWMAAFCRPFTTAKIKYFPLEKAAEARDWVTEARVSVGTTSGKPM